MELTKEQYEKLIPYEKEIKSAYRNSFVHMAGSEFQKIAAIYAEIFPPLRKSQMGCNTCRLNTLRKLGELYINYTEEHKDEKKEKKERTKKLKKETENNGA